MAQSKQTRKFEKRHLSDTLKRRKEFAKVKQRHQVNAKRKAKRAAEKPSDDETASERQPASKRTKANGATFDDMTVDDFFAGEIPLPEKTTKFKRGAEKTDRKRKRQEHEEDEDDEELDDDENETSFVDPALEDSESGAESGPDGDAAPDSHVKDLESLAIKDPEFYKYLQENDAELLDFAETAGLAEIDELSEGEENAGKSQKKAKKGKGDEEESGKISKAVVQKWALAMSERHSLRAMREVVLAFRAAAHLNDESGKQYKYTIANAEVYHEVVTGALKHIPLVLSHHLPGKEAANGKIRVATDSKKFRTLTPLLKSHCVSLQHLLSNLSDQATTRLTLTSIRELCVYFLSFKKAMRELVRAVVDIWSDAAQTEAIRINAFLILRHLTIIGDQGIKDNVLRSTYQGLIKSSRTTMTYNLPGINLMKNSGLELWGLVEPQVAYTTGFTFIRQLAIHLRNSIKNNSNESYKSIYNWQYVHSLDFWSRVLSTHCETLHEARIGKESPLRPLIYPLTQVTLGAMRLIPTSAYFPLRFHLIRALIRLSAATNTFIPLVTPLYEVLQSAEMRKPPRPSTLSPLDFETNIRATKTYLHTRVYQDGVGEQVAELLAEFYFLWCKNIAFPELALPLIVMLRRWGKEVSAHGAAISGGPGPRGKKSKGRNAAGLKADASKGNRNTKVAGMIALVVQKLEANSRFIEEKRLKVEFAPDNRAGVEGFLKELEAGKTPFGAFVEGQRKQRAERRKILEDGRKAEERKRSRDKREAKKDNSDADEFAASDDESGEESEVEADGGDEEEQDDSEMDEDSEDEGEEMEVEDESELEDDELDILVS